MKYAYLFIVISASLFFMCCKGNNKKVVAKGFTKEGNRYEVIEFPLDSFPTHPATYYNKKVEIYYGHSDSLYEIYTELNNVMNGYDETKYYNGRYNRQTMVHNNRKNWTLYHDSLGYRDSLRYFLPMGNQDFPNEFFRFSKNGDTIKNESFYLKVDVGSYKNPEKAGDKYGAHFYLISPKYACAYINICISGEDTSENLETPKDRCDSFPMEDFEFKVGIRKYKEGVNYIYGKVVNYEDVYDSSKGYKIRKEAKLYFDASIYVEPDK